MRLFEAIIDANHRALAGDTHAGLHPADFTDELPMVALTCVDVRLNVLLPQVLGVPPEEFIWLRNAGNIVTGPMSSTMRSLAMACAVKGGKQIAIIGHSDCQVAKTTAMQLIDRLRALGVERHLLPENLNEYFGIFGSERQNVIKGADIIRSSPLVGPKIPVHGLLVDVETGKLEWLVNGYQTIGTLGARWNQVVESTRQTVGALKSLADFNLGEMKFPETKIGEKVTQAEAWLSQKIGDLEIKPPLAPPTSPAGTAPAAWLGAFKPTIVPPPAPPGAPPAPPPKLPLPPPILPKIHLRKPPK
jgi:carbonic anhydrase